MHFDNADIFVEERPFKGHVEALCARVAKR